LRSSLAAALLTLALPAGALETFPRAQELFPLLRADPRQTRLGGSYYRQDGEDKADLALGRVWGLLRGRPFRDPQWLCQWDAEAMSYTRFKMGGAINGFEAVDFSAGLPLSLRRGDLSFKATLFHRSSHLGDDYIRRTGDQGAREASTGLRTLAALEPAEWARLYGGPGYLFRPGLGGKRWSLQWGGELVGRDLGFFRFPARPYAAQDFQSPERSGWNPDSRTAAGLEFGLDEKASRTARLELGYYAGHSPFGQFRHRREGRFDLSVVLEL
jgi:hypothetical protein